MATLHNLIMESAVNFKKNTGKKPLNVYLGEVEIEALKRWAHENSYTTKIDIDIRGENRPEVAGLIVYAVNDVTHLAVA